MHSLTPPSDSLGSVALVLPLDLFGAGDEIEERRAVTVPVGTEAVLGQTQHVLERQVALVLGVAQQHPETGNGGGEAEVVTGGREAAITVDHGQFMLAATVAVRSRDLTCRNRTSQGREDPALGSC